MQITAETVNITVAQPASDLSLIQEWLDKKDNTRLTGCAKLTYAARFDLEEDLKTSCYTRGELARKYGISSTRVSQIATYIGSPPARSRGRRYNPRAAYLEYGCY